MARDNSRPLQKHTLNLFEGDLDKLGRMYPNTDKAVSLRNLLRAHIRRVESRITQVDITLEGVDIQ